MIIPGNLTAAARQDTTPDRREWIVRLPEIVRALAERWELRVGEPFQPGGQCSWVAPVRDPAGRERVLKVGWAHLEAMHEAKGLRHWTGDGTVICYDSVAHGPDTVALLVERCEPGTMLCDAMDEPDQDVVIARLLRRLWRPPDEVPYQTLEYMCGWWADEFERKLETVPAPELDPGLIRAGLTLFRELPATAEQSVLLCTDLHAENVLAARREPWLVIDPKPHVGDPTYDALQHMYNCRGRLTDDPVGLAHRMADLLDLDADRLLLWLFARCVQESLDTPWLIPVARRLAPI